MTPGWRQRPLPQAPGNQSGEKFGRDGCAECFDIFICFFPFIAEASVGIRSAGYGETHPASIFEAFPCPTFNLSAFCGVLPCPDAVGWVPVGVGCGSDEGPLESDKGPLESDKGPLGSVVKWYEAVLRPWGHQRGTVSK